MLQLLYIPQCNRVFGQQPLTEVLQEAIHRTTRIDWRLGFGCRYSEISGTQIAGHNLARQWDKFGHILQDLAALQEEVMLHLSTLSDITP